MFAENGLDLTGAQIHEAHSVNEGHKAAPSIKLPNQDAQYVSHIAIDIGGSLIKLVYFSPDASDAGPASPKSAPRSNGRGGRLHFVKFETTRLSEALDFIEAKGLHRYSGKNGPSEMRVLATGGGAYRFGDAFKDRLGLTLEKEDEMECLVRGSNFLLRTIPHEAFTYESGVATFTPTTEDSEIFPYLLVNIGSGVSMIKVDGDGQSERVSGSSLGGGTFWGLASLLTREQDFDKILELCSRGDNANVDMLVGDIYGGRDYASIGLSATTIASSFGKVISSGKALEDFDPADIAMALCRMTAYNISQLAYLNALRYNLKRVFFGGFFIRGHPYTMDTISFAIRFWSKGSMAATFLRHEGFLGAMGAFLKVNPMTSRPAGHQPRKVRSRFVERFSMGAPYLGSEVHGPAIKSMEDKVSWVEKFVRVGGAATQAAKSEHDQAVAELSGGSLLRSISGSSAMDNELGSPMAARMKLHVGVLHYTPAVEPFPLLADPAGYEPNTLDINEDEEEYRWWLKILMDQISTVAEKAVNSEGGGEVASRRAAAFAQAFRAHLTRLDAEPGAYGPLGLSELFEMREECLREFGFSDVYRLDKERENQAALEVLGDLLVELDSLGPRERLLALVEGVLAANIFDWGAKACIDLYHNGTILEIYREARRKLSRRPWRVDQFDVFAAKMLAGCDLETGQYRQPPYRRVMMFVDNAGADVVLGMLPFARELLRAGCEVVMVANAQPAINDITLPELQKLLEVASELCPSLRAACEAAQKVQEDFGGVVPSWGGLPRQRSYSDLASLAGRGNGNSQSTSPTMPTLGADPPPAIHSISAPRAIPTAPHPTSPPSSSPASSSPLPIPHPRPHGRASSSSSPTSPPGYPLGPKLFTIDNGHGSPCLDLRRVPTALADACDGTDLVVIEGMGRAVHTNFKVKFRCDAMKLAMIKTERLAKRLFGGALYDCVCVYDAA